MWIRTEDNKLINMDKVTYLERQGVFQQTETGKFVKIGAKVVAHLENADDIDVISYTQDEMHETLKKLNEEADEIIDYILEAIDENIFKTMDMYDYK